MRVVRWLAVSVVLFAGLIAHVQVQAGHSQAGHPASCQELHDAAFLDEPQTVEDLISHGVNVDCLDALGQTPLVTAVNGGSADSLNVLIDAGARVDVRTEYGQSLLAQAKRKFEQVPKQGGEVFRARYTAMITRLIQAGALD